MHNLPVSSRPQGPAPMDSLRVYGFEGGALRRRHFLDVELTNDPESLVVQSPEWFKVEVGQARDFVADLTGFDPTDLPEVDLIEGGLSSLAAGNAQGAYAGDRHRAYIDARIVKENPSDLQANHAIRLVAHELAHGAIERATVTMTGSQRTALGGLRWVASAHINAGLMKGHITKEKAGLLRKRPVAGIERYGSFFEEAFAEEAAMRYDLARGIVPNPQEVRQTQPHLTGIELYAAKNGAGKIVMYTPGFAAGGLNILEQARYQQDPEGQSIFELLVAARHQATRATAMRKLAQVVNAVQPNLYPRLNHAPDNIRSFTGGLIAIRDAVEPS